MGAHIRPRVPEGPCSTPTPSTEVLVRSPDTVVFETDLPD